jgi:hypothetical protein
MADHDDGSLTLSLNSVDNKSSSFSLSLTNSILVANFLCHMILPEAQHACEAARAGNLVPDHGLALLYLTKT